MRHSRPNAMLGIALGDTSCIVAESIIGNSKIRPKSILFAYPAGISLQDPMQLGNELGSLLKANGISARAAIIGLPSKWLVTRRKQLPPIKSELAAGSLRLSAEADFSSDLKDLVIDYAGDTSLTAASTVLVVGAARERIDACVTMARAAGLNLRAITSTALALAEAAGPSNAVVLNVCGANGELAIRQSGSASQIRHINLANMDEQQLTTTVLAELRRACAGLIAAGNEPAVVIWADPKFSLEQEIAQKLGMTSSCAEGGCDGDAALKSSQKAHACGFALLKADLRHNGVDFIHSRLAPPTARSNRKPLIAAGAIAAILVLAGALAAWNLHQQRARLDHIREHLSGIAPDVKKAETAAGRLAAARSWIPSKLLYLACLADLTNLFPDEGSIWASTLSLRSDLTGQVMGRASSEQQVLGLLDRLKDSRRFGDLKLLDMRDAGRNSREIAFSISFLYKLEQP